MSELKYSSLMIMLSIIAYNSSYNRWVRAYLKMIGVLYFISANVLSLKELLK